MKNFHILFLAILIFTFNVNFSHAQYPTYTLTAMNFLYDSLNYPNDVLEFDIYLYHTNPPFPLEYAGGQYHFSFNSNFIPGNFMDTNVATYRKIGSDLPSTMQPRNPSISTASNPTATLLRLAVNTFPGTGGGHIITGVPYPGTKIVRMRLKSKVASFNSVPLALEWRNPPIYTFSTKIFAYVGTANSDITTPSTHLVNLSLFSQTFLVIPPDNDLLYNNPIIFSWRKISSATRYIFNIWDEAFQNILSDSTLNDTIKYVNILDFGGIYYWRVLAEDSSNNLIYSELWRFNTVGLLLSPANNSSNNSIPVTFRWRNVEGASHYLLKVSSDPSMNNLLISDSTSDTSKVILNLNVNTNYYWKVTAMNNASIVLDSRIWSFRTGSIIQLTPTYTLNVKNFSLEDSLAANDMIKFDIYIEHTNYPIPFQYAGGQFFFSFSNLISSGNSDLEYSIIDSDLPQQFQPRNPSVGTAVNPTANVLRLAINGFPGAGNGFMLTNNGFPGTKIVSMRLRRLSGTFNSEPLSLSWRNPPITILATKIFAYIGNVNLDVTTPITHSSDSTLTIPLPVELSNFNSSIDRNIVKLNWTTLREINNSGFEIERRNARREMQDVWLKIAFVQGNGTVGTQKNYSFEDKNLSKGLYKYRLKQIDFNGNFEYFYLSKEVEIGIPAKFEISQNYPNPFNPKTIINYQLPMFSVRSPSDNFVSIKVYNITGEEVATLVNQKQEAGYYTIEFDARNLSSGVYFYRLSSGSFSMTKKMMVLR